MEHVRNRDREIYKAINEETHLSGDDQKSLRVFSGYCHPLFRIEEFVKTVARQKKRFATNYFEKGIPDFSELEKECILLTGLPVEQFDNRFEYSEHVKVFYDTFFSMGLVCGVFRKESGLECFERRDLLQQFLEKIRAEVNSNDFIRRLRSRESNCERNRKSLRNYVLNLFNMHARMLILRIDLGYRKNISDEVTDWAAHEHLKKFLNNMRSNSLFQHLLGYVWKLEYGIGKGHHFHFALFFDGARVQKDANLARLIGEYWVEKIMKGEGSYYNCNAHKSEYKNRGIGMVRYHETEKIKTLLYVLDYLAKKDQYLRVKTKSGCRVLGRKTNPSADKKRGRPRERNAVWVPDSA
jgi:hypothetical protein